MLLILENPYLSRASNRSGSGWSEQREDGSEHRSFGELGLNFIMTKASCDERSFRQIKARAKSQHVTDKALSMARPGEIGAPSKGPSIKDVREEGGGGETRKRTNANKGRGCKNGTFVRMTCMENPETCVARMDAGKILKLL